MFVWFAVSALIIFAGLFWFFFVRPAREQARMKASARAASTVNRYAMHTQSRPLEQDTHLTGRAYGALLRMAHGDRQQVEFWIVEAQRQIPGHSRTEIIELLAKRSHTPVTSD